MLREAGAALLVADIDAELGARAARELGATAIEVSRGMGSRLSVAPMAQGA